MHELSAMEREEILKAFGTRLKELRKQKGWTQKELAAKVDIRFSQLNKYESGLHAPPPEKLIELADALGTTVDYLLTGDRTEDVPLHSTRLLDRFRALEGFQADDQEAVIRLLDAMILKHKVQGALDLGDKRIGSTS
jgi:transcriptional regulator with XRE-family HTH domain